MKPITVLIVDDSALIRRLYKELLANEPDIEVVDTAIDPFDAREKIKRLNPDVLTLDIEMPKMDGIAFLEKIMTLRPMPVVMASTLTQKGAAITIRALELGAVDYISKPTNTHAPDAMENLRRDLAEKIRAASKANVTQRALKTVSAQAQQVIAFAPKPTALPRIIAIGSSTGGVEALRDIFVQLPANCPPVIMTQHMPEQFTPSFAARLDSLSQVSVKEAKHGDVLRTGHAYLAPGSHHLRIVKRGGQFLCQLSDGDRVSGHRPSVDVLFESVAEAAGEQAVGVILTGMGKDGAQGLLHMRNSGAYTVGQNQASCVVYGMPRAAAQAGAVMVELSLQQIAGHVLSYCSQ